MIIPTASLSYSDVQDLISCADIDDSTRLDSHYLRSVTTLDPDCFAYDYTYSPKVPAPSYALIEKFSSNSADLYSAACSVTSSNPVRSKYDINWCSLEDYTANWALLDKESQISLRLLALSDRMNVNRFGLKKRNLESHLLLHIGCDMDNIAGAANGRDSVRSNLKSPAEDAPNFGYSRICLANRTVDAKTCLRAYKKFKKEYDPSTLFKLGLVAYQAVITSDASLRTLHGDPHAAKERIHDFFKTNTEFLSKLCNKKRKIMSYAYSHEISVDSILNQTYRAHTHVIFFVKADLHDLRESQQSVLALENSINQEFSDRVWSCAKMEVDGSMLPSVAKKYEDIERSFEYLHRAYSLADQYMREIREGNIRELNVATVETYRNLIWLFQGAAGKGGRTGVRRFRSSHIPRVDEKDKYVHPLLSKAKKTTTIKKEKVKVKKYASKALTQERVFPTSQAGGCSPCSSTSTTSTAASAAAARGSNSCETSHKPNKHTKPSTSSVSASSSKRTKGSRCSRAPKLSTYRTPQNGGRAGRNLHVQL